MNTSQTILVTGARGLLGSHIVARARMDGYDTVPTYRSAPGNGALHLDVTDAVSVEAAFCAAKPSVVIHCASYGVNYADQDPERALSVNLHGSLNVLAAAARHGADRFVHVGSCFEYGSHPGLIREDAALTPTAIYGATKAATTLLLRERARAVGLDLLVVRPFGMWGPGEARYRLIPQVLLACMNRCPLKLTSCEVVRDYTYVEDMAERILALAMKSKVGPPGAAINVGSGQSIVLRDFVMSVARLLRGEELMHFGELEGRPTEMTSLVADVKQLRGIIGDRQMTPVSEGVRRAVARLTPACCETAATAL